MKGKLLSLLVLSLVLVMVFGSTAMAVPPWLEGDEDDLPPGLAKLDEEALQRHRERWETRLSEMTERALRHAEQTLGFEDMDEASWALPYVARARLMNLMVGRGRGSFAPNMPVKRAEVLTVAVRMLGELDIDDELDDLVFDFSEVEWAREWLQIAAEHDLFDNEDSFRPNAPAQREWVAHVMIRVLDAVDSDELDDTGDDLDDLLDDLGGYPDYPAISSQYREDLALALELDIFEGYPDHTLRPHAPISRAEFATVLSNMADLLDIDADWEDEETGMVYVEGEILEIDEDAERISIDPVGSEDEADYNLDPDVEVWLRYGSTEQLAELDDLAAGDRVKMYYHPDGDVEYIFARAHLETVEGTLEELEMPEGDQDGEIEVLVGDEDESQDFALKEWTTLSWDHPPYPGDEVTLEVRDGLAFEVQIEPSDDFPAYFGVLHALEIDDDDEEFILTIIGEDDDELDFEGEIEEVEVSLDGEEAELENLVLGYELDLRTDGEDGFVIEIVAYTLSGTFTGEYFEYDEDAETLEIEVDGESMFFLVDGDYGPSPDDAEDWDFEENEKVEVEYDGYFLVSIGEAE